MTLPFVKSTIKTDFSQLNILIYGFPKSGKSTLASHVKSNGKEPFFISTEDGLGALEVFSHRIKTWVDFVKLKDYLVKNADEVKNTYSNFVIDLISDLDLMLTNHICDKYKVATIGDMEYGRGYSLHGIELTNTINDLFKILPIVFLGHSEEKTINKENKDIKVQSPAMQKKTYNFVNGKVDMIGFIIPPSAKADKTLLTFRPSTTCIAGSRFSHMCEVDFQLDYKDMQGSVDNIINHFKTKGVKK